MKLNDYEYEAPASIIQTNVTLAIDFSINRTYFKKNIVNITFYESDYDLMMM